jgi:acetyl-CoA carboxylase carboxyl transferase subunit beta
LAGSSELPFEHLIDEGSFRSIGDDLASSDPIGFPGYQDALEASRAAAGTDESVYAGAATIGGHEVELAAFDFRFLGGSMGEVAGERIARSIERAVERSVPFILRAATGGARMQEGMRSLVQMPKLVAARSGLADAHLPYIAVLGDPTTGGVLASIAALADITIGEAGATVGFAGPRVVETVTGARPSSASHTAASALGNGLVDTVVGLHELRASIGGLLAVLRPDEKETVDYSPAANGEAPSPGVAMEAARAAERPTGPELARQLGEPAFVLRGDRAGKDDAALYPLLTRILGRRALVLALDRKSAPGPGAFRKARRCLELAVRLALPVVTLIDTKGADPSEDSEAGGIAWEIAALFDKMLSLPVPIVSCVTGEGGSGGALAFAAGDVLLAYEHSIFSVIGPEAAAAILWRDQGRAGDAAGALKLTAHELLRLGIADELLPEPPDGQALARAVAYHLDHINGSDDDLVTSRRARWRDLGN